MGYYEKRGVYSIPQKPSPGGATTMKDRLNQHQCRFHPPAVVRPSVAKVPATGLPAAILLLLSLWLPLAAHGDFDSSPENSRPPPQQPTADAPATPPKKPAAEPQSQGTGKKSPPGKAAQSGAAKHPKKKNK
jgi:hypothetical protein